MEFQEYLSIDNYEEQTRVKHKVFKEYYSNWSKILGKWYPIVNYIDGFAGCGAYKDDKGKLHFGSPLIAANILNKTSSIKVANIYLIESKKAIYDKLVHNIEVWKKKNIHHKINFHVYHGKFSDIFIKLKEKFNRKKPSFLFADPYGVKDMKFNIFSYFMKNFYKPEILLNFMYYFPQRFVPSRENARKYQETFHDMFETEDWLAAIKFEKDSFEKELTSFYVSRFKKIAKFVFPYRIDFPGSRRTYYYLIHLCNHHLGALLMKSSFAKHTYGRVSWIGKNASQMLLTEGKEFIIPQIKAHLKEKYNKSSIKFQEIIEQNIDTTEYLESQFSDAVKELEKEGQIYVERFPKLTKKKRELSFRIDKNCIIYFNTFPTVERKSLMNQTEVEYGTYAINHVECCSHGCKYPCYANLMSRSWGKIKDYEEWLHPKIVGNALEILDKELKQNKEDIPFVHLSFMTDPFMYDALNKRSFSHIQELTLKIITKLNENKIKVTVLTKGLLPSKLRDKSKFSLKNEYGITLVSLSKDFKDKYEPFSAPFNERIEALKKLHEGGCKTWVSIEPYPTPNIINQDIEEILNRVHFVDKIIFGKTNYSRKSTNFKENEEFYAKNSRKIIEFCDKNKKIYHIKEGTPHTDNKTSNIFEE